MTSGEKLVSIGLPTYNRPDSLRRALASLTAQTYRNIEIIVSDNASPDPQVSAVVEELSSSDPRIKYYRQETNLGVLANADFVLQQASGEYFTWVSDDDWRAPEFIEYLVDDLDKNTNVDIAFCDYREVNADGTWASGYPTSHREVFRPFESPSRLKRVLSFYWQDPIQGQCNIFYSLFRKSALDRLSLKAISGNYQNLCMDYLLSFSLIQKSAMAVRDELMCTLTCGNTKYYLDEQGARPKSELFISTLWRHWRERREYRRLSIKVTDSLLEKALIYFLFFPKVAGTSLKLIRNRVLFYRKKILSIIKPGESFTPPGISSPEARPLIHLPNVTLIAMATRNVEETLMALRHSCKGIQFGRVTLLSHYTPFQLKSDIEFHRIEKIKSIDEWSERIIYSLPNYVHTDFALLVHADGFVVNPSEWRNEFLEYDYVGAPWPLPEDDFSYRDTAGNIIRVGNSVSLRSKRLMDLPTKLSMPWEPYRGFFNEDGFICVKNRHIYEAHGMKFAPIDTAKYFSHEAMIPEVQGIVPFAFHKWAGSNSKYPRF